MGVSLSLRGVSIANNSYVDIDYIGEHHDALLCHTNKTDCCVYKYARAGEWYFPNGTKVNILGYNPPENYFYRNRGQSVVRLNGRGSPSQRGRFRCEVPDANNNKQNVFINIGMCNAINCIAINLMLRFSGLCWTSDHLPFWSYY